MKPNIYLDIDGVLLINEKTAAPFANDFLRFILSNFPDSTYWLTTHCWQGINRTREVLAPAFDIEILNMLSVVKPTNWDTAKTDAIDFSRPFLWFDDDLYPEEKAALETHNALDSHVLIDLQKNPNQLKDILKTFDE
ncbi:hypothetical protein IRY61_05265 [Candidatus Saccharibacteria bacterium]|nr:hypothetical protein [Candidatus Saccharibacteria bacterium]